MLKLRNAPGPYVDVPDRARRCSRCGDVRPIDEFPIKNKVRGVRRVWCRGCCRAYGREHYQRNKAVYLLKAHQRRRDIRPQVRAGIDAYLRTHPCVDCGRPDITVLEFDHRDPAEKEFNVGELARIGAWPRVLREIEKCDVRCANCHRLRTGEQFRWAKTTGVVIDPLVIRPGQSGRYAVPDAPVQDALFSTEPNGLRRCSRCRDFKPLAQFPFRDIRAGVRGHYCRHCQSTYRRGHYAAHKIDYITRAMTEAQLKREDSLLLLHEYLRVHPCVDCGETDIRVLEFDHTDPRSKTMAVTTMIGRRRWPTIMSEIHKCDVRCANCHRKRTARQQGWKVRLSERRRRYA